VGLRKRGSVIALADVPVVFNDAFIRELVALARLPPSADLNVFAAGVRETARIYAKDAREGDVNELHHEIAALYDAASQRRYDDAAGLLTDLSPQTRARLKDRLKLPGPRKAKLRLPAARALRDRKRRDRACEIIEQLCRVGGVFVEGRKRPSGKWSRPTFRALLHAPAPRQHVSKRGPERSIVMNLETTWLEATGRKPSLTARHGDASRELGPFARFASKCLHCVGAGHADVVELINELNRRRAEKRRTLIRHRQKEQAGVKYQPLTDNGRHRS
jgi:hypothetical protein